MTTTPFSGSALPSRSAATRSRAVAVMRMHLVDHLTLFVLPLSILAASFVINIVIWTQVPVEGRSTGGAGSVHVFVMIAAMFAVVRGLPFALGMGASRRAFTLGTGLAGLVLAVTMGTLYLVLQTIERATDGWGLQGHFFDFSWFAGSSLLTRWLLWVASFLLSFVIGAWASSIYARWGTVGLVVGGPLAIVLGGGSAALMTWRGWWSAVGGWFSGLTPLTATGWALLACVVLAAATWATLRRVRA